MPEQGPAAKPRIVTTLDTLRVVAEHADRWNIPGGDIDDAGRRGALLDRFCDDARRVAIELIGEPA